MKKFFLVLFILIISGLFTQAISGIIVEPIEPPELPEPYLFVSCLASPNPANVNQSVNFISNVSGGRAPYTYTWSGACSGSFSTCSTSFNSTGTFTATLVVTDYLGNQNLARCSVTVQASLPQVITLPPVDTL